MPRPLPPSSADPFVVAAAHGAPIANALLLHGYTGSPFEMMPLALALSDVGVASTGVVLPGHERGKDGDPAVLNRVSWRDWVRAGEDAFDAMPAATPRVVAGCSMGALVALHVASARPVDALVLLAPALRFFTDGQLVASLAARGLWRALPYLKKGKGSDVADDEGRHRNPCLPYLPLHGIAELAALQRATEPLLSSVVAPACIFHGAHDHTIPPVSSEIIASKLASPRVERHVLRNSFHVIGIDVDRDELNALAVSFVREVVAAAPSSTSARRIDRAA
ncbi:MAG TPA: alpha/beta fold hydrolase [Myxococcota bacterium]